MVTQYKTYTKMVIFALFGIDPDRYLQIRRAVLERTGKVKWYLKLPLVIDIRKIYKYFALHHICIADSFGKSIYKPWRM